MNCRGVLERLSAHIDGRLSQGETSEVEAHLARCKSCQRELEALQATVRLLHRLPMSPVPRPFSLLAPTAPPRYVFWNTAAVRLLQGTLGFAAMLLVVVALVDLFNLLGTTVKQEEASLPSPPPTPDLGQLRPAEGIPTPQWGIKALSAEDTKAPPVEALPMASLALETPIPKPIPPRATPTLSERLGNLSLRQVEAGLLGLIILLGGALLITVHRTKRRRS